VRRKGVGPLIFFVVFTLASLAWTFAVGNSPVLGLDLQGGVSVVLQPNGTVENDDTIDQAVSIIRNRIDALGVAEPDITRQGDTVLVQLPGVKDQCRAIELVGQTAELRFRPVLSILPPLGEEVPTPSTVPAPTTTAADGATTTTTGGGATTTTATGEGEQGLGAGLVPGENAAGLQTTTAPTTTTSESAPTTTAPENQADAACGDSEEEGGDGSSTTTTTTPATTTSEELGLGAGLVPGENAAGLQQTTTTAPATTTTVPAPPTTAGAGGTTTAPPTTAPADDGVQPTCEGVPDEARLRPSGIPRGLDDQGLTPRNEDEPCNTVVLGELDEQGEVMTRYLLGPTALTGDALSSASAGLDQSGVAWQVNPTFESGDDGIGLFNAVAAKCFSGDPTCPSQSLAIVLDSEVISAPRIQQASFERDRIQITGDFDESEAKDLALVLQYGALPVELEPQQIQTVSATLGEDSLHAGLISGLIGLLLTVIFMVGYYRLLGVVAVASLTLEFGLVWVLISYLGESRGLALTLAGVTGLIVSIGISVDSNVVFYEHLKEDVRNGRTFRSTVERSFDSSFATIIKADIASLIGAVLLYVLSVGPVRGFALLLGLSTVIDLIATWFFIRPSVLILARSPKLREKPRWLGMPNVENV
jgi:preprotein translocase subunit SecD